ncbi:hypothetical protein PHYSODRAFT_306892 [Phytophthora sojae]|uniref:Uncharacterized protein n=1 Tax=Phytophthora sojae (strain P6497) TaxID=1094619 RepID=G5ABI5_PHYSP|nr:hypothetical protein PHYSODRAFT_306892 [Phytophthora sojae]EGZ06710.1 hypothetical protein PHYSODRAFT_306892 [Phytophthora sojae]|eukprot:XP_009537474.1 hypothetical protein PHYSODRAFT_306892 [Phytophthora sojae]
MQARSLQFVDHNSNYRRHSKSSQLAYALLEPPDLPVFWNHRFRFWSETHDSFSFDLWFCSLPSNTVQHCGGVIYGAQASRVSNHLHQRCISEQFALVDAESNLYCSVLNEKREVHRVTPNRWYHLALTYNVKLQRQDVYVDGGHVWEAFGSLSDKWQRCKYEQVGALGWVCV